MGVIFMSLFGLIGYNHSMIRQLTTKSDIRVVIFIYIYFFSMIVVGCLSGRKQLKIMSRDFKILGEPKTDFVVSGVLICNYKYGSYGNKHDNFSISFKAPLNGLVVGAILTVVGFLLYLSICLILYL